MPIRFRKFLFLLGESFVPKEGYLEEVAIFLYEKSEREDCITKK
jgi:hypothetical protein